MFKKLLVCNRGEIAMRIIRACNELDIASVAIYSEADRFALHVKRAVEAHCLGTSPLDAYLNIEKIVQLAKSLGCDAIHPGYGFLSENADFAKACEHAGIHFVGPTSDLIALMGSKIAARDVMKKAGIPIIPGTDGNVKSLDDALKIAKKLGYPVMLKATFGGGGRGIRICENHEQLKRQFERVQSEANKAFGHAEVFMEKHIKDPRHIEVQILADHFGHVLHLFERDCSIQRRHQKLVETAPAQHLSEKTRAKLYRYAVDAAKFVGYTNAGTMEFILDKDDQIYFLEMNTRLQVEHPITEAITGIDIVQEQIKIAAGQKLNFKQEDITCRGVAIEFRINAEDPKNDFLPSFGTISRFYAPGGPGVRTDSAIYTGYTIPSDYDSLCAKLVVWAPDWQGVLARSKRALKETRIFGVKTTMPYYLEMLHSEDVCDKRWHTGLIPCHPEWLDYSTKAFPQDIAAAVAAAIVVSHDAPNHQDGAG